MDTPQSAPKSSVISVHFKDATSLFDHYMPQIRGGGIFIETNKPYTMGEELFILLTLPDNGPRAPVAGKIAWMTPEGTRDGHPAGIGIQFVGDQSSLTIRIQNLLINAPIADRVPYTF